MNAPTARTKKKIAAEPYRKPSSDAPTNPWLFSTPYSPFGGAFQSCLNRNVNDVSAHGIPRSDTVAPGAASVSEGDWPLSAGESALTLGAVAAGAEHDGSSE